MWWTAKTPSSVPPLSRGWGRPAFSRPGPCAARCPAPGAARPGNGASLSERRAGSRLTAARTRPRSRTELARLHYLPRRRPAGAAHAWRAVPFRLPGSGSALSVVLREAAGFLTRLPETPLPPPMSPDLLVQMGVGTELLVLPVPLPIFDAQ